MGAQWEWSFQQHSIAAVISPSSSQLDKWLSLQKTLPLSKLVYLDVGPFHQFLRLEFSIPEACFTFLLRDKEKCRTCLSKLSSKSMHIT